MKKPMKPHFTQLPNYFLDDLMSDLKESELRCLLVISRKTYGFQKDIDKIANSQFEKLTGMSRNGVRNGLEGLLKKDLIILHEKGDGNKISSYEVNFEYEIQDEGVTSLQEGVTSLQNRGELNDPTKETNINKSTKEINIAALQHSTETIFESNVMRQEKLKKFWDKIPEIVSNNREFQLAQKALFDLWYFRLSDCKDIFPWAAKTGKYEAALKTLREVCLNARSENYQLAWEHFQQKFGMLLEICEMDTVPRYWEFTKNEGLTPNNLQSVWTKLKNIKDKDTDPEIDAMIEAVRIEEEGK